ncbi:hypothetical protein STEG23_034725 [Scotinomys teguina]
MHCDSCPVHCKVYVDNLENNGNKPEIERAFGYYEPFRSVWVARNPPGIVFVEFEDPRDTTDSVRELEGRILCGCRVRVELSNEDLVQIRVDPVLAASISVSSSQLCSVDLEQQFSTVGCSSFTGVA